jgi:diguanylate cyclase (GGDEF)-like protein
MAPWRPSPSSQLSGRPRKLEHTAGPVRAARPAHERFRHRLAAAVERVRATGHETHAALMIDVDGFSSVQASFGRRAASRLLAVVGNRVRECLGPDDEMLHLGGDAFHVLLDCKGDLAKAWRVAELMRHVVNTPYALDEIHQVAVTASVGVARVRSHHLRPADVLRDALEALHRAKLAGSARCAVFDEGMHEATIERLRLTAELRGAIDRAEFRMHYQPILNCLDGELAGVEALFRWEHPTRGTLAPAEFLDHLFRLGLMTEVGQWIVEEVTRQAVEWRRTLGLRVPIAINVSPRELADPTYVPRVLATLAAHGAAPDCIAFEVTEDFALGNSDAPLLALRQLNDCGFALRIDDFGTGFSSLVYLQRLPIRGLKIDRAFIQHVELDRKRREIVRAIIDLAHVLGLDVVAEGVERREQLDALRALGCDHAQGYFIAAPLRAAGFRAWVKG